MISNNTYYELFASYTVPDPNRVGYWVDLGANSKGKVIKTYNENLKKWVKVTDTTSEDAVAPFIGNNGNWWIDNRDTGISASGQPPFIGNNDNWFTYDSSGNPVDTGKSSKGVPGSQGPKGDKGQDGKGFTILGYYSTLGALQSAISNPSAGDAYGVGSSMPYDIYVYDSVSNSWLNNGAIQGAKGEPGEKGETGPAGKDATINGLTTINIVEGDNISITQTGDTLTISGNGGLSNETDPIFSASPAAKITDTNLSNWSNKQDKLVSGTNIKTINGTTILGSGDIIIEGGGGVPEAPIDGEQYARQDATWTKVKPSEPFMNAEYGKIIKEANESQSITQDNYDLLLNAITSSSNGALFCEYEHTYGRLYFMALPTDSDDILVYVNTQMAHVPEPSFMSGAMTISSDLTITNNTSSSITLNTSGDGSKFLADNGEYVEIDTSNFATKDELEGKQNTIGDLDTIRSNAEKGKQALESLPTNLSQLTSDETHRTVTDSEKSTWNSKSDFSGSFSDLTNIPAKITNLRSYTTATTVASLNVNYESIYVTLTANASISVSATGADYNGRTITAYVYTAAARTITIPTTGNYVSMCGSSFKTTASGWVEFNLTCIAGKWHIAKLEQE